MSSLVAASQTLTATPLINACRQMFSMSDGKLLALYGGTLTYKTSTGGVTWSSSASVPSVSGTPQAFVQNGDTIYAVTISSGTLSVTTLAYSGGTLTGTAHSLGSGVTGFVAADACWDGTASRVHITATQYSGTIGYIGAWNPASPSTIPAWLQFVTGTFSWLMGGVVAYGSTVIATVAGSSNANDGVYVTPMVYSGGAYTVGGREYVSQTRGTIAGVATALDGSNKLDIQYVIGGNLFTLKRTGTAVYASPANIASAVNSGALSVVPNGSDLFAFYESIANGTSEIYVVQRQSGYWGAATRVAGGDGSTYTHPKAAPVLTGGSYAILYQRNGDVYDGAGASGHAPDAPTITAPSGAIGTLSPTITGTYSNSGAPTDGQSAVEYKVIRNSDSALMWNSGWISDTTINRVYGTGSATGDPDYSAPIALSYGVLYTVTAKVKDSTLLPTQASSFSTGVTFTPYQAGTVTLTHVVQDGTDNTTSPVTIDSPTITSVTGSWSQPQTHTADQSNVIIYAADGTTQVAALGAASIGGGLTSGSSITLGPWTVPGLANHTTYKAALLLRDSTSLLWNPSAQWEIDTAWTPPAAVTGFTALPVAHPGYIVLAWTNPGGAVSMLVERSLSGADLWVTLPKTGLYSTLTDWAPLDTWDYRVSYFDASGTQSLYATVDGVTMGADGIFGVSVVDTTNTAVWSWFGPVGDWKQASTFSEPSDVQMVSPFGAIKPTISRRFVDYSESKQREYAVPSDGPYYAAGQDFFQAAAIATFRAMGKAGNNIWYRDINGDAFYIQIMNVERSIGQDGEPMRRLQWDMDEVNGPGGAASPGQPFVQ